MKTGPVLIRAARPEDIPALAGLIAALFAIETDFAADGERQARGLALLLESPQACLLAAEDEAGRIIGMCSGQIVISTAEGGPSALVEDLIVNREWRGQGIGRRLLDAVKDWAESRGATRLQLLADRRNPLALSFYRHLGWEVTAMICIRKTRIGRRTLSS